MGSQFSHEFYIILSYNELLLNEIPLIEMNHFAMYNNLARYLMLTMSLIRNIVNLEN